MIKKVSLLLSLLISNYLFSQINFGKKEGDFEYIITKYVSLEKRRDTLYIINFKFINYGQEGKVSIKKHKTDSVYTFFYKDSLVFEIINNKTLVFKDSFSNIYNILLVKITNITITNFKLKKMSKNKRTISFRRMEYSKNVSLDQEHTLLFKSFYRIKNIPYEFEVINYTLNSTKAFRFQTIRFKFRLKRKYKKEFQDYINLLKK